MKRIFLSLGDRPIGTVRIDQVRGRETWAFAFDETYLKTSNPMIDPAVATPRSRGETFSKRRNTID